jgi:plasmid stabilization system protein ParE
MIDIKYSDTGYVDIVAAIASIRGYFKEKQSVELAEKHIAAFSSELNRQEKLLQEHPKMYRVRDDGHFRDSIRKFRSFIVHWFIVFYSYEEDDNEVVIWFIRPSRSNFSNIVFFNQSRS